MLLGVVVFFVVFVVVDRVVIYARSALVGCVHQTCWLYGMVIHVNKSTLRTRVVRIPRTARRIETRWGNSM